MIGIFNNKTSKVDFSLYNGEYILDSVCLKYEITEELNGEYSFDGIFLISDKINKKAYELLVNDSLLKVDDEYGIEPFRIAKVTKNKKTVEIFARHITISDSLSLFCEDVRPTNLSGNAAINWIFNNARGNNWLLVSSDIPTINTAYYYRKSVYEALFDAENSFLERWGGEVYRRGFNLAINQKVGENRGVSIKSGKNLQGIEERSNINTLATTIYPVGFDGITISEKYIDSPLIDKYGKIFPKEVKFDDIKVKGENDEEGYETLEEAQEELKRRTNLLFTQDKVDMFTSSYTVTFAELQKAEGYKDYSILETTFIGDTVSVFEEKLGIDIQVRVTKRVWDGIKKRRKSTTLSNKDLSYKPPSIAQVLEKLKNVDTTDTVLNLAKEQASALIKSGMKNSYVIVKENEVLIMDTKDINTAIKVWRFNNAGLGYSSTGYYGTYGLAITQDGQIVADFITTGILNADLIRTGILQSFNGNTTLNMTTGKFSNVANGYGIDVERGGLTFDIGNETVGGIRSSMFTGNNIINGVSIANTKNGDYIEIGVTENEDFDTGAKFTASIRIAKIVHELMNNFKGIQFFDNLLLETGRTFWLKSNDTNNLNWHEIYNTVGGLLALFGDNGVMLGYKAGTEKVTALDISETPNSEGNQVFIYKPLSMYGNTIKYVPNIYTGSTGRYFHEGWNGSIEKVAKRISNLNLTMETGLYSFSKGSNGAPCDYGTLVHIKWTIGDIADCSQLVIELLTGRLFVRVTNQDASMWIVWQEK